MPRARPRKVVEHHDNGNLSVEMYFLGQKLNGPHRMFAEDGVTRVSESLFRRGKLHGESLTFHPNGKLASRMEFEDGVLHGRLEEFDEDERLRYRAHFAKGAQHGPTSVFDESGQETVRANYRNGELVLDAAPETADNNGEPCTHCGHNH